MCAKIVREADRWNDEEDKAESKAVINNYCHDAREAERESQDV